jgi:putative two-component system response regulator
MDGSGYPAGLKGMEIPLAARIVALADVYDALTSERPYKPAYSHERAKELILRETGKHFDPAIVQAFIARYDEFLQVRQNIAAQPVQNGRTLVGV